ncbi:MAG: lysylphosphatidylglycerol synthase transmembrane domain-containing protein [Actinomycetota bacterium]|nr:lysylphosphatidylglycerol synthase transmembrane domain-containing protein [Actinomycetota bacterium]
MPEDPSAPAAPAAQLDKKKSIILGIIGLAFIILIFWKVIPEIGSYSEAWDALQSMGAISMALIIASVVIYLVFYGFPFMAAAPGLKYLRSEQLNQAAFAISNGVPGGGAVGLAVQYGMLTSFGITATASTAAITAVGLWSSFVTLGFPILGVGALVLAGQNGGGYVLTALIGLGVLVAVIVIFVLVMRSEDLATKVGKWGNSIIKPFAGRIKALQGLDLVAPVTKFRSSMYELLKRRWLALTISQVAVSVTQFLILFFALRGVEGWDTAGTSILVAFAAFAISQLGMMIPITPGGLGTVDAAMIALMTNFGVATGAATAADLVWRAASFVPQIILGIVALLLWYRKAGERFATTKVEPSKGAPTKSA